MRVEADYIVIGSGVAGLQFASKVSGRGKVVLLTKQSMLDSATNEAQGGVATVMSKKDSFASHIEDTMTVGRGLCKRDIVEMCVTEGPERIDELVQMGINWSMKKSAPEELDLGKEGGHSARRIVHAADATGKEMVRILVERVKELQNVDVYEEYIAVNLVVSNKHTAKRVCKGVYAMDNRTGEVHTFVAPVVVLATGGFGKVYLYTSNPDIATGDGLAMGFRAGAQVANMEFFQFHPTILYHPDAKSNLISEAVRGEGGILRDLRGVAFMDRYHQDKELAPRDVVARAIDDVLKRTGDDHVYLDVTHLDSGFVKERFPNIYKTCLSFGIDMTREPIPVVPGAHYSCGGLVTDKRGRTTVPGLWAIGEVACTGLHGGNRLASNSLLEGLVFAHEAASDAIAYEKNDDYSDVEDWKVGDAIPSDENVVVSQDWDEIRRFMWNYVGIVRSERRLERAQRRQQMLFQEIKEYYWNYVLTSDLLELRNISTVAYLIVECALQRKESRGLHYNVDYPDMNAAFERDTVISRFKE